MLKPLLAALSDGVPIFGYRRRSYIVLGSAVAAFTWLRLSITEPAIGAVLGAMVVGSTALALCDVVTDSEMVEITQRLEASACSRATSSTSSVDGLKPGCSPAPQGSNARAAAPGRSLQQTCWAAYSVGQVATAALSGLLLEQHGPRWVFGLAACFPLVMGTAALMLPEERHHARPLAARSPATSSCEESSPMLALLTAVPVAPMAWADPAQPSQHARTVHVAVPAARPHTLEPVHRARRALRRGLAQARRWADEAAAARAAAAAQAGALWRAVSQPGILWPVGYLALLSATPR
jgi:hypothetical protein